MKKEQLYNNILKKKTCLCVGLDTDVNHPNFPASLAHAEDPVFEFNKSIIEATHDICVAYKPNFAFYEALGSSGLRSLEKTMKYLNLNHPDIFTVADAKRGDIGNTSKKYAQAVFEKMNFDSITLSPYMGENTISPFLEYENKWVIILALTSNKSHEDFQLENDENPLYQQVIKKANTWGNPRNTMFVVGATNPQYFKKIRKLAPDNFFLVPGVGAQGGDAKTVLEHAKNKEVGLLINSSRGIIFSAKKGINFAENARLKCLEFNNRIKDLIH